MILVPPGYSSPLYRYLLGEDPVCHSPSDLFAPLGRAFLRAFGAAHWPYSRDYDVERYLRLTPAADGQGNSESGLRRTLLSPFLPSSVRLPASRRRALDAATPWLHVVFVSRKPYTTRESSRKKINRQVLNEDELIQRIVDRMAADDAARVAAVSDSVGGGSGAFDATRPPDMAALRVDVVDLARMSFEQQVQLMSATDVLIGMHGAVGCAGCIAHTATVRRAEPPRLSHSSIFFGLICVCAFDRHCRMCCSSLPGVRWSSSTRSTNSGSASNTRPRSARAHATATPPHACALDFSHTLCEPQNCTASREGALE
jgi:hypothetical protein